MKQFPLCKNWLKWHLLPERAIIIFPACSNSLDEVEQWNRKTLTDNTNAQESVNKIIQERAEKKKLNVQETTEHIGRFCHTFEHDRKLVKSGTGTK